MSHADFKKHPFHDVEVQGLGSCYNSAVSHLVAIKSQTQTYTYTNNYQISQSAYWKWGGWEGGGGQAHGQVWRWGGKIC